ncbi:MAG: hypothetical protein CVU13_02165 [Bacteroidetes bacterium HGW-Bacteroidetes-8]|jgi:hypothetical protein|nr:MAG: hypothetical protein CVU13_02165 [Bacteroidetes bacterium HGW-Bacteroidetes-8]
MGKKIANKLVIVILISITILSGCGLTIRQQPVRSRAWDRDYRIEYNQRLSHNERRINDLKSSNQRDRVYVIEVRNNNMKRRLDSFKGNSRNEWDSFKHEFDRDMRSVEKSIKDFNKGKKDKKNNNNRNRRRR